MSQKCHRYHKIYVLFCICWQFTHTHTHPWNGPKTQAAGNQWPAPKKTPEVPLLTSGTTYWKTCRSYTYGCFQKLVVPQNGWFIMENPINPWMIWGENPIFSETPTYTHIELYALPDIGLVREFVRVWHPAITFASKKSNPWRHIYSLDSFTLAGFVWIQVGKITTYL